VIAVNIIAVKPAAGPETLRCDLLKYPTTIPPIIPEIIPENKVHQKPSQFLNTMGAPPKNH
jgi:hypothetical protein